MCREAQAELLVTPASQHLLLSTAACQRAGSHCSIIRVITDITTDCVWFGCLQHGCAQPPPVTCTHSWGAGGRRVVCPQPVSPSSPDLFAARHKTPPSHLAWGLPVPSQPKITQPRRISAPVSLVSGAGQECTQAERQFFWTSLLNHRNGARPGHRTEKPLW